MQFSLKGRLLELEDHRKGTLFSAAFGFHLQLSPTALAFLALLQALDLLNALLAAIVVLAARGAKLFLFEPDQLLLPLHFHLHVLLVLFVELRLFLLIAQLSDDVADVVDLLVLDVSGRLIGGFFRTGLLGGNDEGTFYVVRHAGGISDIE